MEINLLKYSNFNPHGHIEKPRDFCIPHHGITKEINLLILGNSYINMKILISIYRFYLWKFICQTLFYNILRQDVLNGNRA
jgi:hypothetical protein